MFKKARIPALAAAVALALAVPNGAAAAPSTQERLNVIPNPWLAPVLDDLAAGQGTGRVLKDLLCPPVSEIDELVDGVPGVHDITAAVKTGACNADLIDYQFHTEFRRPDGSVVVKNIPAVVDVPVILNVDDDAAGELVATIKLFSLDKAELEVQRLGGVQEILPVSVEAVLADPSRGELPRERIAFGFDAQASDVPDTWETVFRFTDVFDDPEPLRFGIDVNQSGATGPMALLAEFFDAERSSDRRRERIATRVEQAKVPARTSADIVKATIPIPGQAEPGDRFDVHLRTALATRTDVSVRSQEENTETEVEASIDKLPRRIDLGFESTGESQRRVDYDAGERVRAVTAKITERSGAPGFTTIESQDEVRALDVPTGLAIRQFNVKKLHLKTRGGPVGQIDGAFASHGKPIVETAPGAYVRSVRSGKRREDFRSTAVRLFGLERAAIEGVGGLDDPFEDGKAILFDAVVEPGPLRAALQNPEVDLEATVRDMPHQVRLLVDPAGPRVVYDGSGQAVDEIEVKADSAEALFGRATHLDATIKDIPASMTLDMKEAGDSVEFVTDNPIGRIDVLASDGHSETLPGDQQGVIYRDQADRWLISGRIFGLRQVKLNPDPLDILVRAGEGRAFSADATIEQPGDDLEVHGLIDKLPRRAQVKLTQDPVAGTSLVFDADAPVERLLLEGSNLELIDRADDFRAEVNDVPTHFEARLPEKGALIQASAVDPIGSLDLQLADGAFESLPDGRDGVIYRDTQREFAVTARISRLRGVAVTTDPVTDIALDLPDTPHPFDFDIEREEVPKPVEYFRGSIDKPQRNTVVKLQTKDEVTKKDTVRMNYSAGGPISEIALRSNTGKLGLLKLVLANLPRRLDVCFDSGAACKRVESPNVGDASLDIDDHNSAHGPIVIDGLICLEPDDDAFCEDSNRRKKFVLVKNLQVREFAFDYYTGPSLSAGAYLDTSNKIVSGTIDYRDDDLPIIDGFHIGLGDRGLRAFTRSIPGPFGGIEFGDIVCSSNTNIGLVGPDIDLSGELCDPL